MREKLAERCQRRGLGRGAAAAGGSEVTNRCPSQPPACRLLVFVARVLISRPAKFLSGSDVQLGSPQEEEKIEL